ncbi:MAG: UvrD-helicase domain-containing protein [Acidobacteriota bacterium]
MNGTPIDNQVRASAVLTSNHAFVWASAGTGKTHTLTLRALYLLLDPRGPLHYSRGSDGSASDRQPGLLSAGDHSGRMQAAREAIRSLALVTFTRKAAAEMQVRLYEYLDGLAGANSPTEMTTSERAARDPLFLQMIEKILEDMGGAADAFDRLRKGAEALTELAAQLQISTIHSFAASILRRHPLEAQIPPTARFAREDETDLDSVSDQIVDLWWQRELPSSPDLQEDLSDLLKVLPASQIRVWLKHIYENDWLLAELERLRAPAEEAVREISQACRLLVNALGIPNGNRIEASRDALKGFLDRLDAGDAQAWTYLCRTIKSGESKKNLFLSGRPSRQVETAVQESPELGRYFESYFDFSALAVAVCLFREHARTWQIWKRVLTRFSHWAEGSAIRELGLVTFDDMIEVAAKLLRSNAHVRRSEQARFRAILVDEFQDTDPHQLELIELLLGRDSGGQAETLGFFVGDLKQSIYSFRGADVPAIQDFRRRYQSLVRSEQPPDDFQLSTSFRSLKPVTDFVNAFFENHVPLAASVEKLSPWRLEAADLPEWVLIESDSDGQNLKAGQARSVAASETVRQIRSYVDQFPPSEPGASATGHRGYKDIVVLVANFRELDVLVPALQDAGIPVVSSGAKVFYGRPEVLDVLNLLIALHHPGDSLAVAAVLRSPLVHLSDPDLHAVLTTLQSSRVIHGDFPLPDSLQAPALGRIEALRGLAAARKSEPLPNWLQTVRNFIPSAFYTDREDREGRALVRIDRVLETFQEEVESGLTPPLVWLLRQRARAASGDSWESDLGEDVALTDESVEAVRVMTIHKAKGLQGRFVIVYGWHSVLEEMKVAYLKSEEARLPSTSETGGESLRGFCLEWGPLELISPGYGRARNSKLETRQQEAARLAYVAATRAQDRLVLISAKGLRSNIPEALQDLLNESKALAAADGGSALLCGNTVRLTLREEIEGEEIEEPAPLPASAPVALDLARYKESWQERYAGLKTIAAPLLSHPSEPPPIADLPPGAPSASPSALPSARSGDPNPRHRPYLPLFSGLAEDAVIIPSTSVSSRSRASNFKPDSLLIGRLAHLYLERHLLEDAFEEDKLTVLQDLLDQPAAAIRESELQATRSLLSDFYCGKSADFSGRPYRDRLQNTRVLGREVPVYLQYEGQTWNGVIDLVLEDGQAIYGIDYKAGCARQPLPQAYLQQQRLYTEALHRLFPNRPIKFEFWWLKPD